MSGGDNWGGGGGSLLQLRENNTKMEGLQQHMILPNVPPRWIQLPPSVLEEMGGGGGMLVNYLIATAVGEQHRYNEGIEGNSCFS